MFSIINTGLVNVLVCFSPGSCAVSTLAPGSARPASDPREMPRPSPIRPRPAAGEGERAASPTTTASSHTPASSYMHESSHTQEFSVA